MDLNKIKEIYCELLNDYNHLITSSTFEEDEHSPFIEVYSSCKANIPQLFEGIFRLFQNWRITIGFRKTYIKSPPQLLTVIYLAEDKPNWHEQQYLDKTKTE